MNKAILHSVLSALLMLSMTAISVAQQSGSLDVPRTISYQGLLTTADGTPLPTGLYDITVTLFADEAGSQSVWQNTYSATVLNGVFNLNLGSGNAPLPAPKEMNRPLWVGTSVNGTGMMAPLTPLTSSPYALNLPDEAVTTNKLADGAVTAEKLGTDYIAEVQVEGQKISAKGTVLNLVGTPSVPLTYDEKTQSVMIGEVPTPVADDEKGASTQAIQRDLWSANGDAYTVPVGGAFYAPIATDMLGPLTVGVPFNLTTGTGFVMVYQPSAGVDNIVGGNGNAIALAASGSVIAGGGGFGAPSNNIIGASDKSVISGGETNTIGAAGPPIVAADYAVIGGGQLNINTGNHSTIGGGLDNQINLSSPLATIGGGANHRISAPEATISGGHINEVRAYVGTIGGGHNNLIGVAGMAATIGGGQNNTADAPQATIAGGWMNTITAPEATIAGGHVNRIDSYVGAIAGGHDGTITATSEAGFIGGGRNNTVAARMGSILGGDWNLTSTSYAQSIAGFANNPWMLAAGSVPFRPTPAQRTNEPLFMVGNGDLSALPIITRSNAFEVSYNGHSVVSHTNGTGAITSAVTGGTYEDNVIYGWAEVNAAGGLICADFGVASIAHTLGTGVYRITLNVTQPDGITAADIDCGAAVATLGTGANPPAIRPASPPAGTTCAYIYTTNIQNNIFDVYITVFNPVTGVCDRGIDLPFKFHVTGRPN